MVVPDQCLVINKAGWAVYGVGHGHASGETKNIELSYRTVYKATSGRKIFDQIMKSDPVTLELFKMPCSQSQMKWQ
jgi:hypothetical protein